MKKKYLHYINFTVFFVLLMCLFGFSGQALQSDFGFSGANADAPATAKAQLGGAADKNSLLKRLTPASILDFATNGTVTVFKQAIRDFSGLIAAILLLAIIRAMSEGFEKNGIVTAFNFAAALTVSIFVFKISWDIVCKAQSEIEQLSLYTKALMPAFAASLAAKGSVSSAALLPATVLAVTDFATQLIKKTFLPLINVYFALCMAGAVSEKVETTGLAKLIKSVTVWAMTAVCTLMAGILGVQKIITAATDNVALKTAKFAVAGMVPVVGGVVKDAYETVAGSVKLICSVSGVFAIAVIAYTLIPIFIRLGVYSLLFKAAAAFSQMASGGREAKFISSISDVWGLIFAVAASIGILLIYSIAVLVSAGGQ